MAGFTKGAVYDHFGSKENLLFALLDEHLGAQIAEQIALFDPEWKDGEQPWVLGRKKFGRIAIANSDSGMGAYTDVAINQAYRAVHELMGA